MSKLEEALTNLALEGKSSRMLNRNKEKVQKKKKTDHDVKQIFFTNFSSTALTINNYGHGYQKKLPICRTKVLFYMKVYRH